MAAELAAMGAAAASNPKKRKSKQGKGKKKPNKKLKPMAKSKNPSQKMKKLFRKRAKAYNSDEEESEHEASSGSSGEEDEKRDLDAQRDARGSDDDFDGAEDEHRGAITQFAEGCRAFRAAFLQIMKKSLPDDALGPIMSAHKKLVAEKLAEEETENKAKGEEKKKKQLAGEKGHVKPASFLDVNEKLLISIATKGVVKLFNAVNKAQNPQNGLNPSRSKDAKELAKRRKQTFLSELKKPTTGALDTPSRLNSSKGMRSANKENDAEPGWAPLRDNYMLTNSKLKDWDKMPDPAAVADEGIPVESSSDED